MFGWLADQIIITMCLPSDNVQHGFHRRPLIYIPRKEEEPRETTQGNLILYFAKKADSLVRTKYVALSLQAPRLSYFAPHRKAWQLRHKVNPLYCSHLRTKIMWRLASDLRVCADYELLHQLTSSTSAKSAAYVPLYHRNPATSIPYKVSLASTDNLWRRPALTCPIPIIRFLDLRDFPSTLPCHGNHTTSTRFSSIYKYTYIF